MNDMLGFILKVVLASTLLSFAIKYGGPQLNIPANNASALIAILLPATFLAVVLGVRAVQRQVNG